MPITQNQKVKDYFFTGILLFALIISFFIIRQYLGAVLIGGVFALIFYPLYCIILKEVNKETTAAFITLFIVLIAVLVPISILGNQVLQEAKSFYTNSSDGRAVFRLSASTSDLFSHYLPKTLFDASKLDINIYIKQIADKIFQNLGSLFSSVAQIVIDIILVLMAFFYFLKDGSRFKKALKKLSPLKDEEDEFIIDRIEKTISSVMRGSLVIGLVQGFLTGFGFMLFGVPNPALWGSVAVVASLVPGLGTSLVIAPGVLFLLLTGNSFSSLLLFFWGLVGVGLIDNFLRPYLLRKDVKIHKFIILLSVLGGISFFGPIGFLLGPLMISFLFALLDIYPEVIFGKKKFNL